MCWVQVCCAQQRRPRKLNRGQCTGVVAVDVDVFRGERELESILDDVLVELVVEERV